MPRPSVSKSRKTEDVSVYNDSTAFTLYTNCFDKKAPPILGEKDAIDRELAIVLPLCQDDSYVMRVRLGPPTTAEKREFVGLASGHMDLSSGTLLAGEAMIQVPKDRYRVEIRSYLPSSMASWQINNHKDHGEKVGAFFRRTRQGKAFPDWLSWYCWNDPAEDPGHEDEWKDLEALDEPDVVYIDFLVCLLPPSSRKKISQKNEKGISEWETRCPEVCPMGIKAPELRPDELDDGLDYDDGY